MRNARINVREPIASFRHFWPYDMEKFKFTGHLSDALEALAESGAKHDLSREDVAFLTIDQIEAETDPEDQVKAARAQYDLTRLVRLPHLPTDVTDIDVVRMPLGRPNFITHDKVLAKNARGYRPANHPGRTRQGVTSADWPERI